MLFLEQKIQRIMCHYLTELETYPSAVSISLFIKYSDSDFLEIEYII